MFERIIKNNTVYNSIFILGCLLLILLGILFTNYISQSRPIWASHYPEKFTELYFTQHQQLPKFVQPGQEYQFAFAIINHEQKNMEYAYIVELWTETDTRELGRGTLLLQNNERQTVEQSFIVSDFPGRGVVTVKIENMPQTIHFGIQIDQ
jgi:hypothetical protein